MLNIFKIFNYKRNVIYQSTKNSNFPSFGLSAWGISSSTLMPTSISVFPIRNLADPWVCGINLVSISIDRYSHCRLPSFLKSAFIIKKLKNYIIISNYKIIFAIRINHTNYTNLFLYLLLLTSIPWRMKVFSPELKITSAIIKYLISKYLNNFNLIFTLKKQV